MDHLEGRWLQRGSERLGKLCPDFDGGARRKVSPALAHKLHKHRTLRLENHGPCSAAIHFPCKAMFVELMEYAYARMPPTLLLGTSRRTKGQAAERTNILRGRRDALLPDELVQRAPGDDEAPQLVAVGAEHLGQDPGPSHQRHLIAGALQSECIIRVSTKRGMLDARSGRCDMCLGKECQLTCSTMSSNVSAKRRMSSASNWALVSSSL